MSKAEILKSVLDEIENLQYSISKMKQNTLLQLVQSILETHVDNLILINCEQIDSSNLLYLGAIENDILRIKELLKESY